MVRLLIETPTESTGWFAGAPSMKAPLTGDRAFFLERLDEVGPHSAPRGGTDIHSALVKAIGSLKEVEGRDRAIVLITDGENLEDNDPMAAARAAAAKDIKIFTIGLGNTTDGARIPLRTEGNLQYLKESDQEVWSKTDGKLLAQLAEVTGGDSLIIGPGDYYDFADFEQDFLLNMQRGALDETLKARKIDRYQWFLGFAVALLLIHPIVPETRRREEESRIVGYQS